MAIKKTYHHYTVRMCCVIIMKLLLVLVGSFPRLIHGQKKLHCSILMRIACRFAKKGSNAYRLNNENGKITSPHISKLVVDITDTSPLTEKVEEGHSSHLTPIRGKFQLVGANFLFHCLHGSNLYDKVDAFRNCTSLLDPKDGVFFGSTILGKELLDNKNIAGETAICVLRVFNDVGVFGNFGDSLEDLDGLLRDIFYDVDVQRVGYCGVWTARYPKV
jgi:hypothetical protein